MMAVEPSKPAPWWRSPRVPAAIAVGALHLALAAAIILSLQPHAPSPLPREVFLLFPPAPQPERLPRRIEPAPLARVAPPFVRAAPPMAITQTPPATTPLEVSLFRCAPENLAKLGPAERAQCGEAFSASVFVAPIPGIASEQARDAARWQVALEQRNAPSTVPCTNVEKKEINPFTHETTNVVVTDPLCVLRNLGDSASP